MCGCGGALRTKLSELAVGDDELTESAQTLNGLLAVLLCSLLVDWSAWRLCVASTNTLCLPDEILDEVALVLGQQQDLGLLDGGTEIGDQLLAILRELGRWRLQRSPRKSSVQCNINLLVGRCLSLGES